MDGPFDFYNAGVDKQPYKFVGGKPYKFIPKVLFPDPRSWPQITERCAKHLKPGHVHMMGISFRAHEAAAPILLTAGSFN